MSSKQLDKIQSVAQSIIAKELNPKVSDHMKRIVDNCQAAQGGLINVENVAAMMRKAQETQNQKLLDRCLIFLNEFTKAEFVKDFAAGKSEVTFNLRKAEGVRHGILQFYIFCQKI